MLWWNGYDHTVHAQCWILLIWSALDLSRSVSVFVAQVICWHFYLRWSEGQHHLETVQLNTCCWSWRSALSFSWSLVLTFSLPPRPLSGVAPGVCCSLSSIPCSNTAAFSSVPDYTVPDKSRRSRYLSYFHLQCLIPLLQIHVFYWDFFTRTWCFFIQVSVVLFAM